jgi:thioredoxin-dependent peroxiredoxin
MKINIHDSAPTFSALDQNGKIHRLEDYRGRWLLLYFYPKDDTPGCTAEACQFRDNFGLLKEKIEIVGISADNQESHQKFADKYKLPFTLLADPEREIIEEYGTDNVLLPKRTSFLINPDGKVVKIYPKVNPQYHVEEIIRDIDLLQKDHKPR